MREIKFRGKRADNDEWIYGYYLVAGGMPFISAFGTREPILVKPETVGQYTGLQDKNKKEIYEGDIIKNTFVNPSRNILHEQILVCKWVFEGFVFEDIKDHNDRVLSTCEIIGNIYENPKLLIKE